MSEADDRVWIHKQLSTPADPAQVLEGIPTLLAKADASIKNVAAVIHGTTLVTNAVIERKGARVGMWSPPAFATCSIWGGSCATTRLTCANAFRIRWRHANFAWRLRSVFDTTAQSKRRLIQTPREPRLQTLLLAPIRIPRTTFYDWYSRYQEGGIEALVDGKPRPRRIERYHRSMKNRILLDNYYLPDSSNRASRSSSGTTTTVDTTRAWTS